MSGSWAPDLKQAFAPIYAAEGEDTITQMRLVVLSAITEAINEKGIEPSATAYYGALMSSLAAQKDGDAPEHTVAAAAYILEQLLPCLPLAVKVSQGADTVALLLVCQNSYSASALVTRHVLACLARLLAAQPEKTWEQLIAPAAGNHALPRAWVLLLGSTGDARPKVRKAAQAAVLAALAECSCTAPAASSVKYCISALGRTAGKSSSKHERTRVSLGVGGALSFLKTASAHLQRADIISVLPVLLHVCTQTDQYAAVNAMEVTPHTPHHSPALPHTNSARACRAS
eukprot:COSAG05_NODE_182_length_14772_cov_42.430655_5_plen_287_part_00